MESIGTLAFSVFALFGLAAVNDRTMEGMRASERREGVLVPDGLILPPELNLGTEN